MVIFIDRGIATLLIGYAYDKGGLPLSVTLRTWLNMINFGACGMRDGGEPGPSIEGNGGVSASISAPPRMIISTRPWWRA